MKLLSITVPCYNSQNYMGKCIRSLLSGGSEVEIIIVNDGSSDNTAKIADEFEANYPEQVRVIHQENGGHGSAVNTGLTYATGKFFKVVDSDDWVAPKAYKKILETLRGFVDREEELDLLISNFVYDKDGAIVKKAMKYLLYLPVGKKFGWEDIKAFSAGKYILMHSAIYRTQLLRKAGLKLPNHTFYVDNIYVFEPLVRVNTMYYLNVNFYHYFIGREDQSVHEDVMISRIDQQIKVNKLMVDFFSKKYDEIASSSKRFKYMYNYLEIITVISSILLIKSGTEENYKKKDELWSYIEAKDIRIYKRLRYGIFGRFLSLKGRGSRKIQILGYKMAQKIYKFN